MEFASDAERYKGWNKLSIEEKIKRVKPKERTGNGSTVRLILVSGNRKTGPMPVSSTDAASCPDACGLKNKGCYAEYGNTYTHWRRVSRFGVPWAAFCRMVRACIGRGQIWRHNEAGDLPGEGDRLDVALLGDLVAAQEGKRGFTFTHKPLRRPHEKAAIRMANRMGFTVNLSADSLVDADRKADWNVGPVAVVLPRDAPTKMRTPAGRHVIVCPNETVGIQCVNCQLCAIPTRKAIIGFRAHGQGKHMVSEIVRAKRKSFTIAMAEDQ